MKFAPSRTVRLSIVLAVSCAFFAAEIGVGFKTRSLALIADAFHYLNDVISYALALGATRLAKRSVGPPGYTYAFRRAEIVGAFFNATFLFALGVSIFLQAIERFVNLPEVDNPLWVLIVGCVGLGMNIGCMLLVGEHGHGHGHSHGGTSSHGKPPGDGHSHGHSREPQATDSAHLPPTPPAESSLTPIGRGSEPLLVELNRLQAPGYGWDSVDHSGHHHANRPTAPEAKNLGLAGVAIHLMGDAVNNVGVILAAAIMWKLDSPHRFYADPAASLAIGLIIMGGSIPLTLKSSRVLLEAAPKGMDLRAIKEDLQAVPGVKEIHDLHVWHLTETDLLATLHCRTTGLDLTSWTLIKRELDSCFRAYGVNHVTISPEDGSVPFREDTGQISGCAVDECAVSHRSPRTAFTSEGE